MRRNQLATEKKLMADMSLQDLYSFDTHRRNPEDVAKKETMRAYAEGVRDVGIDCHGWKMDEVLPVGQIIYYCHPDNAQRLKCQLQLNYSHKGVTGVIGNARL